MAEIKSGSVLIQLSNALPEKAGNLSAIEVSRIPKAPKGTGQASTDAAHALEQAGPKFLRAEGLTAEALRERALKADELRRVIREAARGVRVLKQALLLLNAESFDQLRELNDLVKVQAKRRPELYDLFAPLVEFFSKPRKAEDEDEITDETDTQQAA